MLIVCLYFQIGVSLEMFRDGDFNENVDINFAKKIKLSEGNYALSAEILEQVHILPEVDDVQCNQE